MGFDFLSQAAKFLQKRKEYRRWLAAFLCLALAVTFGTVTALKLYGQAMTHQVKVLDCQYEVHEHTENCYEENEEGEKVLVCGLADYAIHIHNDDCYDQKGELVCPLEEHEPHVHNDDCMEEEKVLICAEEENQDAAEEAKAETEAAAEETKESGETADGSQKTEEQPKSDTVTVKELVCEKEEHTHEDSCYTEGDGCGKENHIHEENCYEVTETLICEMEENHVHGDGCYRTEISEELDCGLEEHSHSDECGEDCELEEHSHGDGCYKETEELTCEIEENHTHGDGCYEVTENLICETEVHEHDDSCEAERELTCGLEEHEHDDSCYEETEAEEEKEESFEPEEKTETGTEEEAAEDIKEEEKEEAGHIHTDDCYETETIMTCSEPELHTHSNACYSDDCFDENGSLIEGSRVSCGLLQLEEHVHTEECFKTVELTPEEIAAINGGASLHVHTEDCYDAEGNLICGHEETHIHGLDCYDEEGKLICGYGEHILTEEEQREIEKVNQLIAELPSEEEITQRIAEYEEAGEEGEEALGEYMAALQIQIQEAYDAYLGLDEALREYVTGADYLLTLWEMMGTVWLDENPGDVPDYAAFLPVGEQGNQRSGMVLELLYGDGQNHAQKQDREDKPDGEEATYTKDGMQGSLKLYTTGILGNTTIEAVTMSLYIPKEYMDREEILIFEFPDSLAQHEISAVTEVNKDGKGYYKVSVMLRNYNPTGALTLPFKMKFKTAEVPADYELKIFATLESGEGDEKKEGKTAENTYRPKYEKPVITKYVNSNKFENMKEDYTRVAATVGEDNTVESSQYVSFWYKLGNAHWGLRAYERITLTDKLPTYVDNAGAPQYAVFDSEANPEWSYDEENHTVSRVFEVDPEWNPAEYDNKLMLQIQDAELKLRFPNCKIDEEDEDGFLTKNLENQVAAVCEPVRPSEGEESDSCEDTIIFTLTNQPGAEGWFAKGNSADTIMDTSGTRSSAYRWSLGFKNESSSSLVNLVIGDEEIDERLKFHSIIFNKEFIENLDHVEAVTYDNETEEGETDRYDLTKPGEKEYFTDTGYKYSPYNAFTWTLTLDPEKEYKSIKIYFKEGFTVPVGGEIPTIWPFSTFRNPEEKHFVEGEENDSENLYRNKAYIAYQDARYSSPGDTYYFLFSENKFKLIDNRENLWIDKDMLSQNLNYPTVKKDANGNPIVDQSGNPVYDYTKAGTYDFCMLYVRGALSADKEYKDLRVIDLLPEALELYEYPVVYGTGSEYIRETEVIENYHNSGRTAVIFYLNVDKVRETLDASDGEGSASVIFTPKVRVKPDASPGTYYNDVYLLSDDLEAPPTGHGQTDDIYNLEGKGTEHKVRWDQGSGNIIAPAGIYAEKFIAKENSNDWKKTALRFKVGDSFQYKLSMMNTTGTSHFDLTVYDVLPRIGDRSINNQAARGSEFTVNLKEPIIPPTGYQVYYTTSEDVYKHDMASLVNADIWTQDVTDWSTVTAFKFVADSGVAFFQDRMDFIVPVKITDTLDTGSEAILEQKDAQDRETGTTVILEATNSFGYATRTYTGQNVESNYVKAQISFAGFVIQKQGENGKLLPGAEFKLEKQVTPTGGSASEGGNTPDGDTGAQTQDGTDQALEWETIAEKVTSDGNGKISFKNLAAGTYRLTETKAPDGYKISTDPVTVTITFDDTTMEYTVVAAGLTGDGTGRNPFVVINEPFYELPETGGSGTTAYTLAGVLLTMLGAGLMYRKKFRKRRVQELF